MPFELKLPDIGEGIAEGEIVRWLVKPGERVDEGQPLVEVMTDKASVEIPAPRSGVIAALLAAEGQVVPVGTAIVAISVDGETPGPAAGATAREAAAARAAAPPTSGAPRQPGARTPRSGQPAPPGPGPPRPPPPPSPRSACRCGD